MKKYLPDIGTVVVGNLNLERLNEAVELIYNTYQHEKIWPNFSKGQIMQELIASFSNVCYRPKYFVAEFNNKIIGIAGYMEAHISSETYELSFCTVHPDYQRKGLGTWLTEIRLSEIKNIQSSPYLKNKDALILTRTRAPRLFERLGFKYIHKTIDSDGVTGPYDYMFCLASEIIWPKC